jgi:hypothetical protein
MKAKVLKTPVDTAVEYIKEHPDCTLTELTKVLGKDSKGLDKWLIILEEYGVINVKYVGFEGYIKYTKKEESIKKAVNLDELKKRFLEMCRKSQISSERIQILWPKFVENYEDKLKELYESTKEKDKEDWNNFKTKLIQI